jgi:hypothetical protein
MSLAIASMHNDPGHCWTLQSLAERVGMSRAGCSRRHYTRLAEPFSLLLQSIALKITSEHL